MSDTDMTRLLCWLSSWLETNYRSLLESDTTAFVATPHHNCSNTCMAASVQTDTDQFNYLDQLVWIDGCSKGLGSWCWDDQYCLDKYHDDADWYCEVVLIWWRNTSSPFALLAENGTGSLLIKTWQSNFSLIKKTTAGKISPNPSTSILFSKRNLTTFWEKQHIKKLIFIFVNVCAFILSGTGEPGFPPCYRSDVVSM